jgi:hypothetical protein
MQPRVLVLIVITAIIASAAGTSIGYMISSGKTSTVIDTLTVTTTQTSVISAVQIQPTTVSQISNTAAGANNASTTPKKLSLTANPNPVAQGASYVLDGTGFPANTNITIEWGSSAHWPNAYVLTNGSGSFSITLEAPTTVSGSRTLAAYNGSIEIKHIQVTVS